MISTDVTVVTEKYDTSYVSLRMVCVFPHVSMMEMDR